MDGSQPPSELLVPPVLDDIDEMSAGCASWQLLSVSLHRASSWGFGIAVSGGRDNPHFTSGDPAVVISDVLSNGPAFGLLQVNDRILSANGVSFENVDYASAVEIIKKAEQINMIVKRKIPVPIMEFEQRTLKFTLSKSRKKEDFGIVVGCKFYIKEIRNPKLADKDPGLREGDAVLRINGQNLEGATLEEVNKWLERSREKLCLVIQRDVRRTTSRWPSQNTVYERVGSVSATPRHSPSPMLAHQAYNNNGLRSSHEYINSPRWRNEGSVTDERRISSPVMSVNGVLGFNGEYEYYNRQQPRPDSNGVRTVVFRKVGGSVGVRVIGGNEVGIFVSAVAADSPAAVHGVCCGDRILEVNGRSMRGVTREAAVQLLLALEDRVTLRLEHARQEFEHVRNNQLGDNFYIRAHFSKDKKNSPLELSLNEGDIFHITDTLFGGTVGLWQASRVYSSNNNKGEAAKGVIPNEATAETICRDQRRQQDSKGKGTLLRRKLEQRRTKSLPKNLLSDPTELSASVPLPAYERVALNTPSFYRPVVLFGPLADLARQQLLSQFSMRFAEPDGDGGIFRLAAIDSVISSGKHCILDISIDSVERLQLAQYAPIVVLIDVDNRSRIREIRKKMNGQHISSKKLAEQSSRIKKCHSHLLSATVDASHEDGWFDALRDLIAHLQQRRLWMPEFPPNIPLEDVLLFPLSTKTTNYDSDMDSLKGDYSDFGLRREDSLTKMNTSMNRSMYDWDRSQHSGHPDHSSEPRSWTTLPPSTNSVIPVKIASHDLTLVSPVKANITENNNPTAPSPGFYHVKQLLNDDSLYHDARLANEIANVRLREEARLREERMKEDRLKQSVNDREPSPLQPPNSNMYSPRDERSESVGDSGMYVPMGTHNGRLASSSHSNLPARLSPRFLQTASQKPSIAPKPNFQSDSVIRNRWNADHTESANLDALSNQHQPYVNSPMNGLTEHLSAEMNPVSNQVTLAKPEELSVSEDLDNVHDEKDEQEPTVVEETSGFIGSEGGVLSCPNSNVELRIPPGALLDGQKKEIYVKVCREGESPPIDRAKGETLLSPLVMCGPQGLSFKIPCELRLPHCGPVDQDGQWSFSLKAGEGGKWKHMELNGANTVGDPKFITVPITHF
ncbi:unnamed protein product [Auanema sp. JU1783]|nr:unnamed protein product [Auanema sp. JU1783]